MDINKTTGVEENHVKRTLSDLNKDKCAELSATISEHPNDDFQFLLDEESKTSNFHFDLLKVYFQKHSLHESSENLLVEAAKTDDNACELAKIYFQKHSLHESSENSLVEATKTNQNACELLKIYFQKQNILNN